MKDEIRKLSRAQQTAASSDRPQSPKAPSPNSNSLAGHSDGFPRSSSRTSVSSLSGNSAKEEEEINMEYLRNVIIKFLESKTTRVK